MIRTARYHVIFDLENCRKTNEEDVKRFIIETIAAIDMNIIAGPVVCDGITENPGLSGFAVLDFSHVSVHTFTKVDEVLVDIFSCKPFDRDVVRKKSLAFFATSETEIRAKEVWWG